MIEQGIVLSYGSGHWTVTVLLPRFAINWLQNQVTRQTPFHDLTHIMNIRSQIAGHSLSVQ